jgi:hypothetical protein
MPASFPQLFSAHVASDKRTVTRNNRKHTSSGDMEEQKQTNMDMTDGCMEI